MGRLNTWTVMIDDGCGHAIMYVCEAKTPNAAAGYAHRIFEAHKAGRGSITAVFEGEPEYIQVNSGDQWDRIDLRMSDAERGVI